MQDCVVLILNLGKCIISYLSWGYVVVCPGNPTSNELPFKTVILGQYERLYT